MPRAVLILQRPRYYEDGALSEVKLWPLQEAVPGLAHRFKYSLFCGHPGRRAVAAAASKTIRRRFGRHGRRRSVARRSSRTTNSKASGGNPTGASVGFPPLASVMTGERYRLLRHLHAQPEASVSALARHLGRHLRRVQEDLRILEQVGLVDRSGGMARAAANRISVGIEMSTHSRILPGGMRALRRMPPRGVSLAPGGSRGNAR